MTQAEEPDPREELQLAVRTCQLALRELRATESSLEATRAWGHAGRFLLVLVVPPMLWHMAKTRRATARTQRLLEMLDQQLDLLRARRGLELGGRAGTPPALAAKVAERPRDLDAKIDLCQGAIARLRRIAGALRDRL